MDDLMNELRSPQSQELPIITVAGIGGGGGNAVDHMFERGITGVNFLVCNTDSQAVEKSPVKHRIVLGDGSGAGNDPVVGRNKTVESLDKIKECLESFRTEMLFLTAGMGGGTGTGGSPVIAKLAREMGILTVAIVTTPFSYEGDKRLSQAAEGIEELKKYADSILIISNDTIGKVYGDMAIYDGFRMADEVLTQSAKGIAELITVGGKQNIDFSDVHNILKDSGRVHFSVVQAAGRDRIDELVKQALNAPLMDRSIAGARNVIINLSAASFSGDKAPKLNELTRISNMVIEATSAGTEVKTNIMWGTTEKPELDDDAIELILVATNFDEVVEEPQQKLSAVIADDSPTPVMLSSGINRYGDIENVRKVPAYQRRGFKMVESNARGANTEVVKTSSESRAAETPVSNSLFDN